jgi:tRNA uridine 5-carbamoylmethylation protein Kti12
VIKESFNIIMPLIIVCGNPCSGKTTFSKYLKEYVNNFRKEQVSIDFLRGQG